MFCPVCRAEYRAGMTICADCNVALVAAPPTPPSEVPPETGVELFYEGVDENEFVRITAALEGAGIPFHEAGQFGGLTYFPLITPHFRIWIAPEDREQASSILADILSVGREERPEPVLDPGAIDQAAEEKTEWNPELATAEFWTGNDASFAQFLGATLLENGIASKFDETDKAALRLLIYPEHEARAREILQEMQRGEPLEE
jgi:hypothetical protein